MSEEESKKLAEKIRSKTFKFPFYVFFAERKMLLYAESSAKRQLWLAAFKYVILSTKEVQNIMRINEEKIQAKT